MGGYVSSVTKEGILNGRDTEEGIHLRYGGAQE